MAHRYKIEDYGLMKEVIEVTIKMLKRLSKEKIELKVEDSNLLKKLNWIDEINFAKMEEKK